MDASGGDAGGTADQIAAADAGEMATQKEKREREKETNITGAKEKQRKTSSKEEVEEALLRTNLALTKHTHTHSYYNFLIVGQWLKAITISTRCVTPTKTAADVVAG